jgi:predicted dehydrogenase
MDKIKVGVIGCGYWGPKLIRNFVEIPEATVVGVADLNNDRLAHIQTVYPQIRVTRDYRELTLDGLDAIVVATPPATHYKIARECLEQGLHVLVEKPLALSSEQARELVELAAARDLVLMVGHTFEYNAAVRALREIITSGEIGEVHYIDSVRVSLGLFQPDLNVIWDLAPHDISILLYILGKTPTAISAQGIACVQEGIEDVAYLNLLFPGNVMAHVHVSWLDPCKVRRTTIVGSRKMVVYDDVESLEKVKIYDKGVDKVPYTDSFGDFQLSYRYGDIVIPNISFPEPLRKECSHFLDCIANHEKPQSDGEVGLKVVKILEVAQRSLKNGGALEQLDLGDELSLPQLEMQVA